MRLSTSAARIAVRIVLAGIGGAIVGIAGYSISQTGGQILAVVVGALVGVGTTIWIDYRRRWVQLSEVSVTVLGSTMTYTATTDMRQAAQRAFFQAATRVATRPLDDQSGNLREALTSLKHLFDLYREPLESGTAALPSAKGDSVYELLLEIVNTELGPFLSYWHPRLTEWEKSGSGSEADWPESSVLREELRQLQGRIRPYVVGLGTIAGLRTPERHLPRIPRTAGDDPVPPQRERGAHPRNGSRQSN